MASKKARRHPDVVYSDEIRLGTMNNGPQKKRVGRSK